MKKQIFSFLLAVMMTFASFVIPASAEVYEGKFSNGLQYSIDTKTGVLTISGEGPMTTKYGSEPWRDYDGMFNSVVIEEGVTTISEYAFAKIYGIESVSIPTTMESIELCAFSNLYSLYYVYYAGTEDSWNKINVDNWGNENDCLLNAKFEFGNKEGGPKEKIITSVTFPNGATYVNYGADSSVLTNKMYMNVEGYDYAIQVQYEFVTEPDFFTVGNQTFTVRIIVPSGYVLAEGVSETYDYNIIVLPGGNCGNNITWKINSNGKLTVNGSGPMPGYDNDTENKVPWYDYRSTVTSVELTGITSLCAGMFDGTKVTSVTIPNTVTSIDARAFRNATQLKGVSFYGTGAYYTYTDFIMDSDKTTVVLCGNKTKSGSVLLPTTGAENFSSIGAYAFADCKNITSIEIPAKVTSIGENAFIGCDNLTIKAREGSYAHQYAVANGIKVDTTKEKFISLTYPKNIEVLMGEDFSLPETIKVYTDSNYDNQVYFPIVYPENLSLSSDKVGTTTVTASITVPDYYNTNGYSTSFSFDFIVKPYTGSCGTNLTWEYDGAGTLTITGSGEMEAVSESWVMFYDEITTVNLPEGLTNIPDDVFSGMTSLEEIDIPETVTSIGVTAFADTKITSLHIPSNVEEISPEAFLYSAIEEFTVSEDNQYFCAEDGVLFNKDKTVLVCYPPCKEGAEYTIPESVTTIETCAFLECKYLEKLNVGANVTMMQDCGLEDSEILIDAPAGSYALEYAKNNNIKYYEKPIIVADETSWGVTWNLYSDGTLEFICNGKVSDYWSTMWEKQQANVTTIKIAEGVTKHNSDDVIFSDFPNVKTVYIPSTFTGKYFMSGCPSIENFVVAEGNPNYYVGEDGNLYYRQSNGYNFLVYCTNRTSDTYTFPEDIKGVMGDAFVGVPELKVLNLHANMTGLDERYLSMPALQAFNVAEGNTYYEAVDGILYSKGKTTLYRVPVSHPATNITLPDTVVYIKNSAFENCKNLVSVSMSDSVTDLGYYTFRNASNLESVRLSDNITSIGDECFIGCEKLSSVNIPSKTEFIGEKVFEGCKSFGGELVIPEGVTWIGDDAFAETGITSVTIPGTVENLQNRIFYNCDSLETAIIEEGVTYIYGNIFCYCDNLKNVTLPTSLTRLGEGVFKECTGLETITISSASIGFEAFKNCDSLKTVVLGNGVTSIAREAFYNCQNLETINLPEGLTRIENNAFNSCGIKEITIPSTVTYMTNYMFNGCQELERITINSNADIPANAFTGLGSLYYLTINGSPSNIAANAFKNCDALRSVEIPASVKDFNASAFYSCDSLESVTLKEGTTSLSGAFTGCRNLSYIYIPDSVTSIADGCFSACPNVTIVANKDTYAETYAKENNINFEVIKVKIVSISQYDLIEDYYEMEIGSYSQIPHGQLIATTEKGDRIYVNITLSEEMDTSYAHTQEILVTVEVPYGYELADGMRESFTVTVVTLERNDGGDCGKTKEDNVTWSIENTILTISGEGYMADYSLDKGCEAPWQRYAGEITLVIVENGVKNIGTYAFKGLYNTQQISIGNTVSSIGLGAFNGSGFVDVTLPLKVTEIPECAFLSCDSLQKLTINGKLTSVGASAFAGCIDLLKVYFAGTEEEWNNVDINTRGNSILDSVEVIYKLPSTASVAKVDEKAGTITLDVAIPQAIVEENTEAKVLVVGMGANGFESFGDYEIVSKDTELNDIVINDPDVELVKIFIWEEGNSLRPLAEPEIIAIRKSGK